MKTETGHFKTNRAEADIFVFPGTEIIIKVSVPIIL